MRDGNESGAEDLSWNSRDVDAVDQDLAALYVPKAEEKTERRVLFPLVNIIHARPFYMKCAAMWVAPYLPVLPHIPIFSPGLMVVEMSSRALVV